MLLVLACDFVRRAGADAALIIGFTALLGLVIPDFLPHRHDRYFYAAGAVLIVLACSDLRFFPAPLLAELASLHCYLAYFSRRYIVHPRWGGLAMLAALLIVFIYTATRKDSPEN